MHKISFTVIFSLVCGHVISQNHFWENGNHSLKGTQLMEDTADKSDEMLEGINAYFDRLILKSIEKRNENWNIDFTDPKTYEKSISKNRKEFSRLIGIVDSPDAEIRMEYVATDVTPSKVAETDLYTVFSVRWNVFEGVCGEGFLIQPKQDVKARVIAIPDADQTPEMLTGLEPGLDFEELYPLHLAENGIQIIIPVIVDRTDSLSGNGRFGRLTNQPHREWIYRQAYTFGRHIIGYEVQKIIGAVSWFDQQNGPTDAPLGVIGWGEGGLLALYSSAIDTRIDASLVSGYFGKREELWTEPIYRNIFGLLRQFGDAEIARLIAPRKLIVEYSAAPDVKGPPPPRKSKGGVRTTNSAAPGKISTQSFVEVDSEVNKARHLLGKFKESIQLIHHNGKTTGPVGRVSLTAFLEQLNPGLKFNEYSGEIPLDERVNFHSYERQLHQVARLEEYTQKLIQKSRHVRDTFFWDKISTNDPAEWQKEKKAFQNKLWNEVIGRIPSGHLPQNPRSRQIYREATWHGYEVTMDVLPGVKMWGYLLLPKDLKKDEKRPVIVAQHGGGGVPAVVMDKENKTYKGFAVQLVERGYIVFAPHFPWKGGHRYRDIQRKANPLGLSVFSIILNQHESLLNWLTTQPWVDPDRIGLYGLSWGGKVAVRVPALLDGYSLSVCSGDFNEWIWKNATTDWHNSYMFVPEYEMFDFDLGSTFNYGEMAALIAPRAFMVERGHEDGVGIDEWVSFEYAKVKRFYDKLGIPDRTKIEYFDGGHEINAKGTFEFIKHHFDSPLQPDGIKTDSN